MWISDQTQCQQYSQENYDENYAFIFGKLKTTQ